MKKEIELIVKKEIAPLHWRVKAGARNKLIQKEREEHEATHVPCRDWCTHCMMGRGRTHDHVNKRVRMSQADPPLRWTIIS